MSVSEVKQSYLIQGHMPIKPKSKKEKHTNTGENKTHTHTQKVSKNHDFGNIWRQPSTLNAIFLFLDKKLPTSLTSSRSFGSVLRSNVS